MASVNSPCFINRLVKDKSNDVKRKFLDMVEFLQEWFPYDIAWLVAEFVVDMRVFRWHPKSSACDRGLDATVIKLCSEIPEWIPKTIEEKCWPDDLRGLHCEQHWLLPDAWIETCDYIRRTEGKTFTWDELCLEAHLQIMYLGYFPQLFRRFFLWYFVCSGKGQQMLDCYEQLSWRPRFGLGIATPDTHEPLLTHETVVITLEQGKRKARCDASGAPQPKRVNITPHEGV